MYPNAVACPELNYAQQQADNSAAMQQLHAKYGPVLDTVSEVVGKSYLFNDDIFDLFVRPRLVRALFARVMR